MSKIVIYQTENNETRVEVHFEGDTFWLSLNQIAILFDRDKSVISRHLNNIYKTRELDKNSTVAKNATVQLEGNRRVEREIEYYNLDAIISVGYRVNSKRGTQFRIWSTLRLKEYLVEGYSINEKRLNEKNIEIKQLKSGISLLRRTIEKQAKSLDEVKSLAVMLYDSSGDSLISNDALAS